MTTVSQDLYGLAGKVCVVTGGGGGIGAGAARRLAAAGGMVAVLDRNEAAAVTVAAEIAATGGRAIGLGTDVADPGSVATAAVRIRQELGPCRVLVNNAAIRRRAPLLEISLKDWEAGLAVNLTGALICTQAFVPQMGEHAQPGGSIIHVASITGHHAASGSGFYSTSKAGLMMLSRQLSVELGSLQVRSNVVTPGFCRTPATEAVYSDPEATSIRSQMVPSGRIASPEDMANVITFLAGTQSSYVNGQEIIVDGGLTNTLMNAVPKLGGAGK